MPHTLRRRSVGSAAGRIDPTSDRQARRERKDPVRPPEEGAESIPATIRPEPAELAVLDCILANTREMKKLALRAGYSRVALILEMAELEAADQMPKVPDTQR